LNTRKVEKKRTKYDDGDNDVEFIDSHLLNVRKITKKGRVLTMTTTTLNSSTHDCCLKVKKVMRKTKSINGDDKDVDFIESRVLKMWKVTKKTKRNADDVEFIDSHVLNTRKVPKHKESYNNDDNNDNNNDNGNDDDNEDDDTDGIH
jgi:hypothetical protein